MSTMTNKENDRVRHYLRMLAAKIRLERTNTCSKITSREVLKAYDAVLEEIQDLERAILNQIEYNLQRPFVPEAAPIPVQPPNPANLSAESIRILNEATPPEGDCPF